MTNAPATPRTRRLLDYLERLPSLARGLLSFDPRERSLYEYFRDLKQDADPTRPLVLVQCVEDLHYFALFGQIVCSIREHKSIRVEQFVLRSMVLGESRSPWLFLKVRWVTSPLSGHKWVRLYRSFCDAVAYRSTAIRPIDDAVDLYRAWRCWRNLKDRKALMDLEIGGIPAGDLVNDSFLRFKPAPTVTLGDTYLWILIWQAHRDVRRAKDYISRRKPAFYLTSYSTYVHHGIAARVALQNGVRVFSFGNLQEFYKELTVSDWLHTKNADRYAADFAKLDCQEERIKLADAALSARIAGAIDPATAYMKKSAYEITKEPVPDVKGALVVFLHDFYDSPHIYRDVVFPDFWQWVCFTIETLQAAGIRFFLKPHPNQVVLNHDVLADLRRRYPGISTVTSSVTNKQLAEAGLAWAVTVYGTVAHEMAYLGVPTIACARHPHISFEFCRTARNRREYADLLQGCANIAIDRSTMRRESLAFYYMHNLNLGREEQALRDVVSELRVSAWGSETNDSEIGLVKKIAGLPAFERFLWSAALLRENDPPRYAT